MKLTLGLRDDLLELKKVDKQKGKVVESIIPMRRVVEISGDPEKPEEVNILLETGQGAVNIKCPESIWNIKKLISEAAKMANARPEDAPDKKETKVHLGNSAKNKPVTKEDIEKKKDELTVGKKDDNTSFAKKEEKARDKEQEKEVDGLVKKMETDSTVIDKKDKAE